MVSYLATATLAVSLLASTPQPLQWQADYGQALEATRAGDQPLLVVLDDPDAEQARLEPELLSHGEISGAESDLLRPYHLCHVDVSTDYGKKVAKAFKAEDFPFTAIIDKTGSVIIFSKAGKLANEEWQDVLKKYREGDRPGASTASQATTRVSYKISQDSSQASTPDIQSPNYCPSCQRRSM